jgi:multidrug resistance efflux pump
MSEQDTEVEAQETVDEELDETAQKSDTTGSVKRGGQAIALVILLSLTWYLLADRFTPFTSQARIAGYVVGVAPKVAGVVTQVWVSNNQEVEQGQRLFEIDPSQYKIALDKARSDLENAHRQVGAGSAAVDSARANLRASLANQVKAQQNATRLGRLRSDDPGTISERQLEVAKASLAQARAQVAAARANIEQAVEKMGGEDDSDNAILKSALSAVHKAELDLANTIVTASARGITADLRADVGRYAGTGSPVLTLIAINDVWIDAKFTENNLGHLKVGTPVEILFDVMPGELFAGEVRSIGLGVSDGQADSPGTLPVVQNNRDWLRQSQRFPVVISFSTEQKALREQLRVGGQVSVIAYTEGHGVLKILGKAYIRVMSWLSYAY